MKGRIDPPVSLDTLRRRAETKLQAHEQAREHTMDAAHDAAEDARRVHELRVHQIELEMQNDALQQAHDDMEQLLDGYIDLYDNAPVGYLTLDSAGAITQMNLTAARTLGIDRAAAAQPRLGLFVAAKDRASLSDFLATVFADGTAGAREITIARDGHLPRVMRIEGSRSTDGDRCRLVMLDVTSRPGLVPPDR